MQPDLHADCLVAGRLPDGRSRLDYSVHNAGGGIAKEVAYVFVNEGQYVSGILGIGLVRSGDTYRVRTPMETRTLGEAQGIVACRDARERIHVWDIRAARRPLRLRHRRGKPPPSLTELFMRVYPAIDLHTLQQVASHEALVQHRGDG